MDLVIIFILFFSIIIHEVSHALTALWQGDRTAEMNGRITLNPIPHIDILGTIILPVLLIWSHSSFLIGWAKPVPINPNNFKNKKWGEFFVALAGPLSNIFLAIVFLIFMLLSENYNWNFNNLNNYLFYGFLINISLAIFNLFPIPPLDGSKILYSILPFKISFKVRDFLEKHSLIIFIIFLLILNETNLLEKIVRWIINLIF